MSNTEELKTMIKCFRVHELRKLLNFAGRSRFGKKRELRDRALLLLKLQSEPLSIKIKQLYNMMHSSDANEFPPSVSKRLETFGESKFEDSITIVDDGSPTIESYNNSETKVSADNKLEVKSQRNSNQSNSSLQLTLNPLCYPIQTDVKFKKLPFYKVLYELLQPSNLIPKGPLIQQRNSFIFYLTHQQVAAIILSRDLKPEEESVQGQLRFCLLETSSTQEDTFPAGLNVRVNDKFCNIQEQLGRRKKEAASPINITPLMKINSTEPNRIEVQWNIEYGLEYFVAVYLVQKKTSEDLLSRLIAKGVSSPQHTRKMIKDKLYKEADSDIVTTSLRVSLMCPIGKMRLKFPCRASTCQHLQCFDASFFLQMNEKKPTWTCPVCDNLVEYEKLLIDGYFQEILFSNKLPSEITEFELHSDGSWSSPTPKSEESFCDNVCNMVKEELEEVIDVATEDSDCLPCCTEENFSKKNISSSCSNSNNKSMAFEKKKVDEIDLTVSDSDDEPLIWCKRRELSLKKKNDVSIINSNVNSPTVINLSDSESSDSLPIYF